MSNKNKKKSNIWLFIFLGSLIYKVLRGFWRKNNRGQMIKKNLSELIEEEKKELKKYENKEESFGECCKDSVSIFSSYFIPGDHNGHKPKILRTKSLALILLALFIFKLSIVSFLYFSYPNIAKMEEQMINDILKLTNDDRLKENLQPLALNAALSSSAQAKAEDMLNDGYFAHYSPDGKKPWDWIDRGSYAYLFVGENLAMNFTSAISAHTALMNSPTHKKNILNEKYRDIGLAIVSGELDGKKTNILVELFGSQQSATLALSPTPDHTAGTSDANANKVGDTKVLAATKTTTQETAPQKTSTVIKKPTTANTQPVSKQETKTTKAPAPVVDISSTSAKMVNASDFEKINTPATSTTIATSQEFADESINKELNDKVAFFSTTEDVKLSNLEKVVKWSKYVYYIFAILLIIALIINIFVKIKIQHKPVLIQTIFTILLIIGLMSIKLHALETITKVIAVI